MTSNHPDEPVPLTYNDEGEPDESKSYKADTTDWELTQPEMEGPPEEFGTSKPSSSPASHR